MLIEGNYLWYMNLGYKNGELGVGSRRCPFCLIHWMPRLPMQFPQVVGGTGWSHRVHAGPVTRWLGRLFLMGRGPGGELDEPPVPGSSMSARPLDVAGAGR